MSNAIICYSVKEAYRLFYIELSRDTSIGANGRNKPYFFLGVFLHVITGADTPRGVQRGQQASLAAAGGFLRGTLCRKCPP